MKAFTDIEQSKKLAEFLPLESADMWFANGLIVAKTSEEPKDIKGVFPCWSLTALLDVLPHETKVFKSIVDNSYLCECPKCSIYKRSTILLMLATNLY